MVDSRKKTTLHFFKLNMINNGSSDSEINMNNTCRLTATYKTPAIIRDQRGIMLVKSVAGPGFDVMGSVDLVNGGVGEKLKVLTLESIS